jgi:exodeoxyribonuclease VII large subunit
MQQSSTPITVSQLTLAIKNQLESRFSTLCIQGEISNAKLHSSGHLYFDLKDKEAKISAVLFKNSRWPLSRPLKEGDSVTIWGSLSLYPPHGKYQIIVKRVELAGQGALLQQVERLKQLLKEKGWFDPEKKKPLPSSPKKIGVVTSPTGAVIQDILHVLNRRLHGFHVILYPVRVQGAQATREIATAIKEANRLKLVDVLIVGRGGGSLEDLWAFNEIEVLTAIYNSDIPIISAVGHETDVTLADFVADKRAPTPSAAAEIVSKESLHFGDQLRKYRYSLACSLQTAILERKKRVESVMRHPYFHNPASLLATPYQKLDEAKLKLQRQIRETFSQKKILLLEKQKKCALLDPKARLQLLKTKIGYLKGKLHDIQTNTFLIQKRHLESAAGRLCTLSPKNVLKRGYSILFSQKENSIIMSPNQIQSGDRLKVVLSEGEKEIGVL